MTLGDVCGWFFDIHIAWYVGVFAVCAAVLFFKMD